MRTFGLRHLLAAFSWFAVFLSAFVLMRFVEVAQDTVVHGVAFSPHRDTLIAVCSSLSDRTSPEVREWNAETGSSISRFRLGFFQIGRVKLSREGRFILCAEENGTVHCFDIELGKTWSAQYERRRGIGAQRSFPIIAFSPDSAVAATSVDRQVSAWYLDKQEVIACPRAPVEVASLSIESKGRLILLIGHDGSSWILVRKDSSDKSLWSRVDVEELSDGRLIAANNTVFLTPRSCRTPFAYFGEREVQLGDDRWRVRYLSGSVTSIAFGADGEPVAMGTYGKIWQMDWANGDCGSSAETPLSTFGRVSAITYDPCGERLAFVVDRDIFRKTRGSSIGLLYPSSGAIIDIPLTPKWYSYTYRTMFFVCGIALTGWLFMMKQRPLFTFPGCSFWRRTRTT